MKNFKKMLSLVLCFLMLVSAMPVHAFAAEESDVTNGTYTGETWAAGGTGTITHTINGTEVDLSKTVTPVPGMENTYEITLQVQTSTHHTYVTASGAVVLVIDESNSMDWCAICGGGEDFLFWDGRHESDCQYSGTVSNSQSRMYAAKAAAREFLETYAGTDASASRMLAIVTFSTGYTTDLTWVNVAGGAGKNGYDSALRAIDGLSSNGGTNLEGGLYQALQELGSSAISGVETPSVVLLTDGTPTYRMNGGSGSSGSAENNSAAANRATAIKNAGAELYTVCFGVANDSTYTGGPTVGNFLRDSVSSGSDYAYNADNADELMAAFKSITKDIVEGLDGSGWTATDPMPDHVDVTGAVPANFTTEDGSTYTWELSDPQVIENGADTTYIYTCTYRITLDVQVEGFVEGQYYPTNEPTYLNIGGEHYAFPVPGVKGVLPRTEVSVTKVWSDNDNRDGLRTNSVTLQLQKDGVAYGEPVVLSAANNWTYTWSDLIEMSGGVEHAYTVVEAAVEGYKPVYTANGNELIVTNVHEINTKDITVTKTWVDADDQDGIRPSSITVALLADGEQVATAEVTAANGWTYTFAGFPVNKAGQIAEAITYTVAEVTVDGYKTQIDGFAITNTHEPEVVAVEGSKTWVDADDQDGIRPESITINLLADGQVVKTATANEANGWAWSFEDLPKYAAGKEIVYTIEEVAVEGYTSVVNGYDVTNTHTPATVEVAGAKTWNDADDQDGLRPESITINLLADGEVVQTATANEANGWAWSFTDLPKNAAGEEIAYTIEEVEVEGYETKVDGYNVTNTHVPATVEVSGTKTWADDSDRDGVRPESITINLLADEVVIKTVTVTEAEQWSWRFTDLPKYKDQGTEIVYTITEESVDGYTTEVDGYNVTNTHENATVEVNGSKTWVDAENQDGIRPESITINLLADGKQVGSKVVTAADNWSWSFQNLLKYRDGGVDIVYTIEEVAVDGYKPAVDGYNVTNIHAPETVEVTGSKTWVDAENQDGIRPESITINLLADGTVIETVTVTEADGWAWTFENLPKYRDQGTEIVYTVTEETVSGYETEVNGYNVTNTHETETTSVSGTKTWNDADDQDGVRPESITINLLADGQVVATKIVTKNDNWSWTFENLPKYRDQGTEIVYTVTEEAVTDYETEVNGFNVTNTHTPATVEVAGTKTWNDDSNRDGVRPESITINLLADGQVIKTVTVTEADGWAWSFTDLPKYRDQGVEIIYTITEETVQNYSSAVNGYNVTNSHAPALMNVTVTKIWDDANDQDGIRPTSIQVQLYANDEALGNPVTLFGDAWSFTWTNVYVYADGEEIVYTVKEVDVPDGYDATVEGLKITNTHKPAETTVSGSKTWNDGDNRDGLRPESITINLLADGEEVAELVVTAENGWEWTFEGLPVYADGQEIVYTITEDEVKGYEASVEGFNVTNTHAPEVMDLTVEKIWNDAEDQDGKRPESIEVQLLANGEAYGEVVVLTGDSWSYTWEDLFVYAEGVEITYTVEEVNVPDGYEATVDGLKITNTHTPETVSVSGGKTWDDADNQDGIRPESITVNLLANGKEVAEMVVSAETQWTWTFNDLPKYEAGVEIVYTVTEDAVEGYEATVNGFDIVNTHTPSTVSVEVKKVWNDNNDMYKIRPVSITVVLLANGEETGATLKLNAEGGWVGSFADLPEYANGQKIVYTVNELKVEGYSTSVSGNAAEGFTVTNDLILIPETGDETNILLYGAVMGISFIALIGVFMAMIEDKKRYAK